METELIRRLMKLQQEINELFVKVYVEIELHKQRKPNIAMINMGKMGEHPQKFETTDGQAFKWEVPPKDWEPKKAADHERERIRKYGYPGKTPIEEVDAMKGK